MTESKRKETVSFRFRFESFLISYESVKGKYTYTKVSFYFTCGFTYVHQPKKKHLYDYYEKQD